MGGGADSDSESEAGVMRDFFFVGAAARQKSQAEKRLSAVVRMKGRRRKTKARLTFDDLLPVLVDVHIVVPDAVEPSHLCLHLCLGQLLLGRSLRLRGRDLLLFLLFIIRDDGSLLRLSFR